MKSNNPTTPTNERARIETLRQYAILDTDTEDAFDDITLLASVWLNAPIALITFVDTSRQWFKSRLGIEKSETPREVSFCAHAILQDAPLVVPDTQEDERFRDNPMVLKSPFIRFYAGAPLISPEGFKIGSLCVMDHVARVLEPLQINSLKMLARQVVALLELRRQIEFLSRALEVHREAGKQMRLLNEDPIGSS